MWCIQCVRVCWFGVCVHVCVWLSVCMCMNAAMHDCVRHILRIRVIYKSHSTICKFVICAQIVNAVNRARARATAIVHTIYCIHNLRNNL